MARFISFPGGAPYTPGSFTFDGVSGSFLSTPDTNLLDSDTAHLEQSIGLFGNDARMTVSSIPSTDALFGSNIGVGEINDATTGAGAQRLRWGNFTPVGSRFPVTAGLTYSASVSVRNAVGADSHGWRVEVLWYDIGNTNLSRITGSDVTSTSTFQQVFATGVAPVDAVTCYFILSRRTGIPVLTHKYEVSAACLREGSDPTFIPSLNIVGDIEMEASALSPSSANQTLMGTWTGSGSNGYQFAANVSGNLLARHGDGSVDRFASGSNPLTPGVFQTVKGSFDAAGNWSFDIAGVSETVGPTTPGAASPSGGLAVGSNAGGTINLFTGDIKFGVVRDGVAGPVVASFDHGDYTGAAGSIPDGTTFVDSVTGRIWTVNGNIVNVVADFGASVATPNNGLPSNPFIVKTPPDMPDILDEDYWVVGAGWVGDGFKATMHDGTDATGPVVAEFDAGDVGI